MSSPRSEAPSAPRRPRVLEGTQRDSLGGGEAWPLLGQVLLSAQSDRVCSWAGGAPYLTGLL